MTEAPLVVHVIQHLIIGGLENGIVNLINRTPRERLRHAVVCLSHFSEFRERIRDSQVPVVALGKRGGIAPRSYVDLWRTLRALRPAIVHTRNLATVDCAPVSGAAGVPVHVHGEHGWDVHDLHGRRSRYLRYRRLMRPFVDRYVAVSKDIEHWLAGVVGVPADRIVQIYNGVDTQQFRPREGARPRPAGLDLEVPEDGLIVGSVGRMQVVKNPLALAEAFVLAVRRDSEARRRLRLVMIGDGPLRQEALRLLHEGGAAELAWLPGARDDVAELLHSLDVFVLPSLNEGVSNTILEAMASGLPVIAAAVGGNGELVVHGQTGELVPQATPQALATALCRYLDDPARCAAHGGAARRRASEAFSMDVMVEGYLSLYESLLGAGSRSSFKQA
jgi:sugar transferase (PEP-CTERM/EpsH1 system associated)